MPSLHTIGGDSVSQAQQKSTPRKLDDDDFSVAPSLDVEMRSVVNHSFNDIYERGKKVSSECAEEHSCSLRILVLNKQH